MPRVSVTVCIQYLMLMSTNFYVMCSRDYIKVLMTDLYC